MAIFQNKYLNKLDAKSYSFKAYQKEQSGIWQISNFEPRIMTEFVNILKMGL